MVIKKIIHHLRSSNGDWKTHSRNLTIRNEVSKFTKSSRETFIALMISALGLVAALSWNDAIRSWIDIMFPEKTVLYKFISAIVVTIFTISMTYVITKLKE